MAFLVESSEHQRKAVIKTTDAEPALSALVSMSLTLKLNFLDVAPLFDVPINGSTSSP